MRSYLETPGQEDLKDAPAFKVRGLDSILLLRSPVRALNAAIKHRRKTDVPDSAIRQINSYSGMARDSTVSSKSAPMKNLIILSLSIRRLNFSSCIGSGINIFFLLSQSYKIINDAERKSSAYKRIFFRMVF